MSTPTPAARLPWILVAACLLPALANADDADKNAFRCYTTTSQISTTTSGDEPAIVMSDDGVIHIAHRDAATGFLTHTRRDGHVWTDHQLVFTAVDDIALEVGDDLVPTVAWVERGSGAVKWRDAEAALPTIETINPAGPAARTLRLVSNDAGLLAIIFYSSVDGGLHYAERVPGGSWTAPLRLGNANGIGGLAFDAMGKPWVVYATGQDLRVAQRPAGSWSYESVRLSQPGLGPHPAICKDNGGLMQLAWTRGTTAPEVMCSYKQGTVWIDETVGDLDNTTAPRLEIFDERWGDDITITHAMEATGRYKLFNRFAAAVWDERTFGGGALGTILAGAAARHMSTGAVMAFRTGTGLKLHCQEVPSYITGSFSPNPAVGGDPVDLVFSVQCADRIEFDGEFLVGGTIASGVHSIPAAVPGPHTLTARNGFFSFTADLDLAVVPFGAVSFTATPAVVAIGNPVTLAWAVEGADTVTIAPIYFGSDQAAGTTPAYPLVDTTYTLWAENTGYGTIEKTAAVDVELFTNFSFTATGGTLVRGETATLQWSAIGAETVLIEPGGLEFTGPVGQMGIAPYDTTTYTMTATNVGYGQRSAQVTVPVVPLRIATLTADPAVAVAGEPVILAWDVDGTANVVLEGIGPQPQTGTTTVMPGTDSRYILTATWEGFVARDSVDVQVVPFLQLTPSFSAEGIDREPPALAPGVAFDVYIHWTGPARRFNGLEFLLDLPAAGIITSGSQLLVSNATNFGSAIEWQIYGNCVTSRTNLPVGRVTLMPLDTNALAGQWLRIGAIPGGVFPDGPGFFNCSAAPVDLVAGPALPLDPALSGVEVPTAGPTAIVGIHPNPFNPRARIDVMLSGRGEVQVAVYDLAGRRVCGLDPGAAGAGVRTLTWDGRDEAGREAPSGVYLVRLTEGGAVAVGRATLVR